MRRRWRVLGWTIVAGLALAALAVFGLASSHSAKGGRPAPALPREQLAGSPATIPALLASAHGRPALVVFWASWCAPCLSEAAALERFSQSQAGKGRIAGVDWSDGLAGARSFIRRYSWTFPNVRDAEGTTGNEYGITGLPTTFVLDAGGRIQSVLRGPQTERTLAQALAAVERA